MAYKSSVGLRIRIPVYPFQDRLSGDHAVTLHAVTFSVRLCRKELLNLQSNSFSGSLNRWNNALKLTHDLYLSHHRLVKLDIANRGATSAGYKSFYRVQNIPNILEDAKA